MALEIEKIDYARELKSGFRVKATGKNDKIGNHRMKLGEETGIYDVPRSVLDDAISNNQLSCYVDQTSELHEVPVTVKSSDSSEHEKSVILPVNTSITNHSKVEVDGESQIENTKINKSYINLEDFDKTSKPMVRNSEIKNTDIDNTNKIIDGAKIDHGYIMQSNIKQTTVANGQTVNSDVKDSALINARLLNDTETNRLKVDESTIQSSIIDTRGKNFESDKKVNKSQIFNSTIATGKNNYDCNIDNSKLNAVHSRNKSVMQDVKTDLNAAANLPILMHNVIIRQQDLSALHGGAINLNGDENSVVTMSKTSNKEMKADIQNHNDHSFEAFNGMQMVDLGFDNIEMSVNQDGESELRVGDYNFDKINHVIRNATEYINELAAGDELGNDLANGFEDLNSQNKNSLQQ